MTKPSAPAPDDTFVDTASQPETRGIELIAPSERHGKARELFAVWAAPNVSVLNFTMGATLTLVLGLEVWQALLVILASCLLWVLPGIVAVSGPAAGTSGSVITRAIYGIRGNRIVIAFYGWFISGVFLALNWVASTFMGVELLRRMGLDNEPLAIIGVTVVVSAITVLVAVYGHALILRAYTVVTTVLLVIFLVVTGFLLPHIDWGFTQPEPLGGHDLWVSLCVGFAILASTPLSYSNSADLARYLPAETKPASIIAATALGGAIPCFLFTGFGALLGTAVTADALDLGIEYSLLDMIPGWLGPIFVLGVVVNTIALNGMTTYTSSMVFQSIGVPIKRIPSAILIGVLGTVFTIVLAMSTSLISAVNLLLQFLLIISVPTMAVYVADILLRKRRYDAFELFEESKSGAYWFANGFGVAGLLSAVVGGVATALFLSTDIWVGPLAEAAGGLDLSVPVGLLVSAGLYVLLARPAIRKEVAA
ncbi:nitrate reductase [Leucobacter sp. OLJS4]|uniref:purine-cytosine permease family protein n=1 Tax=unclassified Leucobacter TaxID=2621730 RepID=UPI000C530226|nr:MULTISPECIES: cytosine permease [unclassified Leucobacter]PII85329.1 nitrate reductase [Leucobacter sp. OLCALW19]PII93109.1 nitrate reductase [Leucobacter sp. OLAS13]PII95981.1 nitrate reductase [Leucobacter sp. OLTLW20]PII99219.1 nitrate reductase [Leucobacter sp. OLDS2]PIJ01220.1 nitrate reductase [Leucobacter sp. OLIS6]